MSTTTVSAPRFLKLTDSKAGPIVIFVTAAGVLYTRSVGVAYYSIGAICCSLSVKAIKLLVRQPRPARTAEGIVKKSYG